jgi:hypothetical protein
MQGVDIKIQQAADFVKPSYSAVLTVPLTPPRRAGEYKGYWQMKSDAGVLFGSKVWVDVVVR